MTTQTDSRPEADLERIIAILRRRAGLIALCTLVAAAAAYGFSKQQAKEYTATASLVFDSGQVSQQIAGLQPVNANDTAAEQSTRVQLLQLGPTARQTAKKLDHRVTAAQVKESISILPQGESSVIDVSATWTSPRLAAQIANTYAKRFVGRQAAVSRRYFADARQLVEKQYEALPGEDKEAPQGLALLNRIQSLAILSKLNASEARVARLATVPGSPSSPKVARNTILGALLGLLLGLGAAFLLERLNRQLREPEEAQEAFGLPVLGTVPKSKAIMASNKGTAATELPFMENEAFRMLSASLRYFNVDDEMRTVLIASHNAGVGKSTIAWNLARVGATSAKAIIVETDLRNPTLAEQHGLEPGPGLSEVLTRQAGLHEAIQFKPIATSSNGAGGEEPALHAIVAGTLPPNPAELLESQAMSELLAQLTERYDLVVLDTAPVGVVSDCFPLLGKVDGVLAVARIGRSTRDSVARLREQLDRLDAKTLGIVANGLTLGRRGRHRYGYGYYGGYDGKPAEHPTEVARHPVQAPSPSQAPVQGSHPGTAGRGRA